MCPPGFRSRQTNNSIEPTSKIEVRLESDRCTKAALFISHDFAATRYVASRLIVMKVGEVVDEADSSNLFHAANHPYTRALQEASGLLDG